jgi:hypothetical protein
LILDSSEVIPAERRGDTVEYLIQPRRLVACADDYLADAVQILTEQRLSESLTHLSL